MIGKIKDPKIFPIDFAQPWWRLIFKQKGVFFLLLIVAALMQIFLTVSPFLVALVFESGRYLVCVGIFALWLAVEIITMLVRRLNVKFQLQSVYSVYQNAHLHLLSVDPQYHVHRSSGAILGKIERAARGYEDIMDYIIDDYTPLIVGLLTVIAVCAANSQARRLRLLVRSIAMKSFGKKPSLRLRFSIHRNRRNGDFVNTVVRVYFIA